MTIFSVTYLLDALLKYGLPDNLSHIKLMSKNCFAEKVKNAVYTAALQELVAESHSLKKTASLEYKSLKVQDYFSHLYISQARIIFKWRSKTLDLKSHLTYKYSDMLCRGCKLNSETPDHVINCGDGNTIDISVDVLNLDTIDDFTRSELKQMVMRINSFLERVKE